jgi:alanine-glyoxylate transaminase/serine-glyoxylate transaminase/serine-pyruvate transaminase
MGLALAVAPEHRLPQLNSVLIPEGVDDAAVRSALLQEFDLEIGAGLGALAGKTWRIGLMGFASSERNVLYCLAALENVLARQGAAIAMGKAIPAAHAVYQH